MIAVLVSGAPVAAAGELEGLEWAAGHDGEIHAGTAGHTFVFFFTASSSGFTGEVVIAIPAGWSAPQKKSALTHGYVRLQSTGKCAGAEGFGPGLKIAGSGPWTITRHVHCVPKARWRVEYGIANGTGNVVAPSMTGEYFFGVSVTTEAGTESSGFDVPVT
jgi:hypothetical protein